MWSNNGFHGHGGFQQDQANFHRGQESYQQNYTEDGYIPFSRVTFGQQYFQPQHQTQGIQYNDGAASSEQSTPGEYQPELGLYNEGAFSQNQFASSDGPEQYTSVRQGTNSRGTPRPTLNARAEELKAQLLRSKERAKSGTPPMNMPGMVSKTSKSTEEFNSFRESPKTPGGSSDGPPVLSRHTSAAMDEDLNDLISEAKAAANVKKERTQNDSSISKPHHSSNSESSRKPLISTADASSKTGKPAVANSPKSERKTGRKGMSIQDSNGDLSDASEGEIRDVPKASSSRPPGGPRELQASTRPNYGDEQMYRKLHTEENKKASHANDNRGLSPYRGISMPSSRVSAPRPHQERQENPVERSERQSYQSNNNYERSHQPELEQRSYQRRDTRETIEEHRKHEGKYESRKEESRVQKAEVPKLAQLLEIDEDLKEWLDITGYHNAEYRNKILNRRRAIAALDVQKAKLLAEMEIEERGGLQSTANAQVPASDMLPPPIPSKMGVVSSSVKKADDLPIRSVDERSSSKPSKEEMGNKRSYTDYRETRDEEIKEKIGRVDERGRGIRIKSETQVEDRRPYSREYDSTRPRSPSVDRNTLRHDERDSRSESRNRDRGRSYGDHRDVSPGEPAYEKRLRARSKSYDFPSPEERQDRLDWKNRPYVQRGNYRGRAYDPNYRGRGRGRGHTRNEVAEPRFEQRETSHAQPQSQLLAFMKPYRDSKPLNKGGKGDTRYFIVKSFNEENVVKCVEDSIWTTQKENGEVFKKAFLTCKNVIFVFSVNHSRAFQGYARMENTPGSEKPLPWMNSINWESAGAFKVKWLCVASTRFQRVGHLKNRLNENQPVLIGRDGQEIEERCGEELLKLIDEEADRLLVRDSRDPVPTLWDE